MLNLKDLQKRYIKGERKEKNIPMGCRIGMSYKLFILRNNINLARLVERSIDELRKNKEIKLK